MFYFLGVKSEKGSWKIKKDGWRSEILVKTTISTDWNVVVLAIKKTFCRVNYQDIE